MKTRTLIRWIAHRPVRGTVGGFDYDHRSGFAAGYQETRNWLRWQGVKVIRREIMRHPNQGKMWLGYDYFATLTGDQVLAFKLRFGKIPWRSVEEDTSG